MDLERAKEERVKCVCGSEEGIFRTQLRGQIILERLTSKHCVEFIVGLLT